jgi:hypothetical protein
MNEIKKLSKEKRYISIIRGKKPCSRFILLDLVRKISVER